MPRKRLCISCIKCFHVTYIHLSLSSLMISWYIGDHMNHLRVVLQVLKENQLFAKYRICEFLLRSMTFLGHIILSERVVVYPRKMEAVKNWPKLLTPTDIRSFLRLEGYFRRFVDGFVSIASPLTTSTKKCEIFDWSEACVRSFQILKDRIISAPMLILSEIPRVLLCIITHP